VRFSVKVLGLNKSEVHLDNGTVVFFSYRTPVAAVHDSVYYRTTQKYSPTTSKHVSRWRPPYHRETKFVGEEFLATLLVRVVLGGHFEVLRDALQTAKSAIVPYMGQLPDLVMQQITEAQRLLTTETEGD
jgi:hypothetical protein